MSANTVTVTIPERLYNRLQAIAKNSNQAISDVLIASAEAMLVLENADTALSPEVADELAAMRLSSDEALWASTQSTLSPQQQARMSELTQYQAERTLTAAEQNELDNLLAEYDRSVLRRAQAFALLSLRGHTLPDINETG